MNFVDLIKKKKALKEADNSTVMSDLTSAVKTARELEAHLYSVVDRTTSDEIKKRVEPIYKQVSSLLTQIEHTEEFARIEKDKLGLSNQGPSVTEKDIEEWVNKLSKSIEDKSKHNPALHEVAGMDKGPKFYRVWVSKPDHSRKRAYCFIDKQGNIYKASGWKVPAKGIRGHILKNDPSKMDSSTGWLYR